MHSTKNHIFTVQMANHCIAIATPLEELIPHFSKTLRAYTDHISSHGFEELPDAFITINKSAQSDSGKGRFAIVEVSFRKNLCLQPFSKTIRLVSSFKVFYYGYFEPIFHTALRRLEVIPLHAISLFREGKGMLICGPGGAGKTTTALHLIQQGWHLLNDDDTYLVSQREKVFLWAPSGPLYITQDAVKRYPHLCGSHLGPLVRRGPELKYFWKNPESQGNRYFPPHFILFPEVAPKRKTRFQLLNQKETLLTLLSQKSREQERMRKDLFAMSSTWKTFTSVANRVPAARLILGHDLEQIPKVLKAIF